MVGSSTIWTLGPFSSPWIFPKGTSHQSHDNNRARSLPRCSTPAQGQRLPSDKTEPLTLDRRRGLMAVAGVDAARHRRIGRRKPEAVGVGAQIAAHDAVAVIREVVEQLLTDVGVGFDDHQARLEPFDVEARERLRLGQLDIH
jgi:hypothetical protein